MVTVVLSSNKIIEVTKDTQMDNTTFDMLVESLSSNTIADVIELAYFLRSNYTQASRLLDVAEKKTQTPEDKQEAQIQRAALMVQHRKDAKEILDRLEGTDDRRYEFVRGVFLLNNGQCEDAQFCFEKVGYKRGLEMCTVMRKDVKAMGSSTDSVVKCYYSSENWELLEPTKESRDFLYRIGKSEVFNNENNIDVQLKQIEDEIDTTEDKEVLAGLGEKLSRLISEGYNSAEIFYNIGKTYHIREESTIASKWYEKALEIDENYLPAEFNLARINGTSVKGRHRSSAVSDYNAITAMGNLEFDVDLNGCSEPIRKLCWTIIQSRLLNEAVLSEIDNLKSCVSAVVVENNKAILLDNDQSVKICTELLNTADTSHSEFIKYNLGIFKKDPNILDGCSIPEAQIYRDYFRKNTNTANLRLRAYLTENWHLLDGMDDTFSVIFTGNGLLNEYSMLDRKGDALDKAEAAFRRCLGSPYCINGLGICAVYRNNVDVAIRLFSQILSETPAAGVNLGLCYLIREDYKRAAESVVMCGVRFFLEKCSLAGDVNTLLNVAEKSKNLKLIDELIECGIFEAKKIKAVILLEKGEVKAVEELRLDDKEIQERINEANEKENERKRKIAEIEEYRKKRML